MHDAENRSNAEFAGLLTRGTNFCLTVVNGWKEHIKPKCQVLLTWDPEEVRYYFFFYALAVAVGLAVLFQEFLRSDHMLFSNDVISSGIFYRTLLKSYLFAKGGIPPWNPYICCGLPFIDAIHGGALYPLTIIDMCGSMFRMIGYNFIFHFFLSGVFMYVTARQLKLSKLASTFAGVSYMFAPCFISWVAPGHDGKIYAATFFPLVILFLERVLKKKCIVDATLLGLVFGVIILTPHLQMAYYVLWVIIIYSLYKLGTVFLRSRTLKPLLHTGALITYAVVLGLAISAVQLLPSFTYLTRYSIRAQQTKGYAFASKFSLREEEVFSQIVPEFCGADKKNGPRYYWGKNSFKDNSESAGIITLFLALVGLLIKKRSQKYFWASLALLVFLYALGSTTPFLKFVLSIVPYSDAMEAPSTSMFIFVFCVAVLGGIGVQNLLDCRSCSQGFGGRLVRTALWVAPVVLFLVAEHFTFFGETMLETYSKVFHPSILPSGDTNPAKWTYAMRNLPRLQSGLWLATIYVGAAAILIRFYLTVRRARLLLWLLPIGVVIADGHFNKWFLVLYNQDHQFGGNPVVEYLSGVKDQGRAVTFPLNQYRFQLGYYGIPSTVGVHGKELIPFYDLIGEYRRRNYLNPRLANLTGTRYIICRSDRILPVDSLGSIPLDTGGIFGEDVVLINKNAFPRTYLVSNYHVIRDLEEIHRSVLQGEENLRQIVYLEEEPQLDFDALAQDSGYAAIEYYGEDSVAITVYCQSNKLLILTDNFYPAWHAYVDGVERRVYRAYGCFRAVELPAGSKQVLFVYSSPTYQRAKLLTFAGMVVVFLVLGVHTVNRIRYRTGR